MTLARLALITVTAAATPAHAEETQQDPHLVTVAVEPMYLAIGFVEANVEVQPTAHLGLQAIGGYGGWWWGHMAEVGAAANVYVDREARGLHFGTEVRWMWGSVSIPFVSDQQQAMMSGDTGTDRIIGIYAGWKWVGWRGLTAVLQLGVGKMDHSGPPTQDVPAHQVIPAGNLVAGYTF
ncbi:MAG: hypothetical protein QM831_24440 [Kofleriaceae bacterium]